MGCIKLQCIIFSHLVHIHSRTVTALFHHLHHHSHATRHLTCNKSRCIFKTFWNWNLRYIMWEFIFKPETEACNIFFWNPWSYNGFLFRFYSQVFLNFLESRFDWNELFAFKLSDLLEKDFIDLICKNDDIQCFIIFKWLKVGRLKSLIESWVHNEVDLFLSFFHLWDVIIYWDNIVCTTIFGYKPQQAEKSIFILSVNCYTFLDELAKVSVPFFVFILVTFCLIIDVFYDPTSKHVP